MPTDDPLILNIRAYSSLSGASSSWRTDLAALLNSDAPIERWVRDAIAEAIANESATGPRLDLKNHDASRRRHDSIAAKPKWMIIGGWINARRAEGRSKEDVLFEAADRFSVSEQTCDKAGAYYKKAAAWITGAAARPAGEALGFDVLENIFHQLHATPQDKSFLQMNAALLAALDPPQ